jgi:hypothetical protein
MDTNPFIQTDFLEQARDRVTEQFKEKPVIDNLVQLITKESLAIQSVLADLMQKRTIDTATGIQLDHIGNIVGQPRDLFDSVIYYFFGFVGASGALSYGTSGSTLVGGRYKSLYEDLRGARFLNDDEYRALIKIKILKNTTQGTIDDFIEIIKLLYNVTNITYTESSARISLNIGRSYNDPQLSYFKGLDEIALGDRYIPLPLGIDLDYSGTIL